MEGCRHWKPRTIPEGHAEETRALVLAELPDLELPFRYPPGTRRRPLRDSASL